MPTQYKKNPNEDTAYFDGHKVNLIAVPAGTLQLPIHPTSDSGYVVDNNGKKHRVLMATFISGTVDYKSSPTADSAYVTINGQKVKVRLAVKENGALTLSDKPNVDKGYVVGNDSEKHRVTLINTPTGTLELPNNETDDSAYIIDGDGNKIKVRMFALLSGGYVEVTVKGVSPLSLPDAVANSLSYVKAFGGTEQRNLPDGYIERQFIYMMDGSYLLTDIVPTYDCKVEMDFQTTSVPATSFALLGGRSVNVVGGLQFAAITTGFLVDGFSISRYSTTIAPTANTRYKFTFDNKVATLESGGSVLFTNTFTGENANGAALAINALNSAGTISGNATGIYLYSFKAWNAQGELVADYVPAVQKGTVPVVGFYDTVSGTFKTATAGTFAAGGEAVPTPNAPVDIVSNNGVLKARHQSGLPLGYTLLDYIESTGTQYLSIPYRVNNKTVFYCRYNEQSNGPGVANAVFGVTDTPDVSKANYGILRLTGGDFNRMGWGDSTPGSIIDVGAPKVFDTWYEILYDQNKLYQDGTLYATSATDPSTVWSANYDLGIFARKSSSVSMYARAKISSVWAKEDGEYVFNLVPAKNSSNVVGMYDMVSGTFFTNAGTGTFTAGNTVSDPVEIYTDGTVETIEDTIGNTATAEMLLKVGNYQDVQSILDGVVTRNVGVKVLDGTEDWAFVTGSTAPYALVISDFDTNAPSNRVNVISTHLQGIANSASWQDYDNKITSASQTIRIGISAITTLADFKQFLVDQYAAGTPVMIIYPLATPTTESVTGQTLQVTDGDNVLEITQASLNGLELEAQYQAAVSLTIQEVQDANLDPNVEVTIN